MHWIAALRNVSDLTQHHVTTESGAQATSCCFDSTTLNVIERYNDAAVHGE